MDTEIVTVFGIFIKNIVRGLCVSTVQLNNDHKYANI
jgi:hypothetical protein